MKRKVIVAVLFIMLLSAPVFALTQVEVEQKILETDNNLRTVQQHELSEILNLNGQTTFARAQLQTLLQRLAQPGQAAVVEAQLNALRAQLPRSIEVLGKVKDKVVVPVNVVSERFADKSNEVAINQGKGEINLEATLVKITWFDSHEEQKTVIQKIWSYTEDAKRITIYEILPKPTQKNKIIPMQVLYVNDQTLKAVQEPVKAGEKYSFSYIIERNDLSLADTIYTILVQEGGPSIEEYSCGDGICTVPFEDNIVCPADCQSSSKKKITWVIIIALLTGVAGIFYFNFYRGKGDFRRLTAKSPFTSKKDLKQVVDFISWGIKKEITKQKITSLLIKKGWTKKQVTYAYEEIEWEERKVLLDTAPKTSDPLDNVRNFITECRKKGIEETTVRAALIRKGWHKEQISSVFSK